MRHKNRANPPQLGGVIQGGLQMRRTTLLVLCTLGLTLSAFATNYPDTLKVNYFANAHSTGFSDATFYITNTGLSGGSLCADIFVYDPNQEISECGACLITPNGLQTLSVNNNLTSNPLTGKTLTTGTVAIISAKTTSGSCPLPTTAIAPAAGLRAWATHIQTGNQITETDSQDETLSGSELGALQNGCFAISLAGSGSGQISCGTGE
jgi:hypothetical protein